MPIMHIHLMEGRSEEKKRLLVKNVTQAVSDSLEINPEKVKIVLHDMAPVNYAVGGILKKDKS